MKHFSKLTFLGVMTLLATQASAAPLAFSHTGVLRENDKLVNGERYISATIYDTASGEKVGDIANQPVNVVNGIYNLTITNLDEALIAASDSLELELQVGTNEPMSPRLPINSVPFAISANHARNADTADSATEAQVAKSLDCEGCVAMAQLNSDVQEALDNALSSIPNGSVTMDSLDDVLKNNIEKISGTLTDNTNYALSNQPGGDALKATSADLKVAATDKTNGDKIQIGSGTAINIGNTKHAASADSATKATNDAKNRQIDTTYQTITDMANYLKTATASSTYQTKSDMANYLKTADASSTYLKKTDASSKYQTITDMANYLKTATASSTYQTKSDMANYLKTADASSTYLKKTDASSIYQPKGSYLTGISYNSIKGGTDTSSSHLQQGTVTGWNIKDGTIKSEDIADSAITSAKIVNGTITADDIASKTITNAEIKDSTIKPAKLAYGGLGAVFNGRFRCTSANTCTSSGGKYVSYCASVTMDPENTYINKNVKSVEAVLNSSGEMIAGKYRVNFTEAMPNHVYVVLFDQAWGWKWYIYTATKEKAYFEFQVAEGYIDGSNNLKQRGGDKLKISVSESTKDACVTARENMLSPENYLSIRFAIAY